MPSSTVTERAYRRALSPDVELAIATWRPRRIDPDAWSPVATYVHDVVRRLNPDTPAAARWQLWAFARFTVWTQAAGVPLEVERQLTPEVVYRYCETALEGTVGTRRTVRDQLVRYGRALTIRAPWPAARARIRRSHISAPYTDRELRLLEEAVPRQSTPFRSHQFAGLLALGAGCGLDGRWVAEVYNGGITVSPGGVSVSVPNPPRTVTCLRRFEHHLVALPRHDKGEPLLGTKGGLRRIVSTLVVSDVCPPVSLARLRSTWLLEHLLIGTPIAVLLKAAGLVCAGALDELVAMVPALDPARAHELLRGPQP